MTGGEPYELDELERALGYRFLRRELVEQGLTHSSYAHEQKAELGDNERLEFLGDAILGFLISDFLCEARPNLSEGELSKLKAFLVSAANLVQYAEQIRLGTFLRLGRGEDKTGGRQKQALLVNAFEAVIAAIYIDGGLSPAREVVHAFFKRQIEHVAGTSERISDFKTALQEDLQSRGQPAAEYRLVEESGPEHQKLFTVEVCVGAVALARGIGLTKKAAEQAAAMRAIQILRNASSNDAGPDTE